MLGTGDIGPGSSWFSSGASAVAIKREVDKGRIMVGGVSLYCHRTVTGPSLFRPMRKWLEKQITLQEIEGNN